MASISNPNVTNKNISKEILEEIENVLNPPVIEPNGNYVCIPWDVTKDSSCVSVYDVLELIKSYKYTKSQLKQDYEAIFKEFLFSKDDRYTGVVIYDFDYDKQELRLGIDEGKKLFDYKDVIFSKKDGDLYLKSDETSCQYGKKLLFNLGDELSEIYDDLNLLSNYDLKNWYNIHSVNSNFYIDSDDVIILISNKTSSGDNYFEIYFSFINNVYHYDCNSLAVSNAIKGHEEKLFKNIYVEIKNCPKCLQEELYEIRKKQLLPPKEELKEEVEDEPKIKKLTLFQKISAYFKQ